MAYREDRDGAIQKWSATPQGGVCIMAAVTRVGVLTYRFKDGTTRRELRHPDEVLKEDSLRTLRLAPVTDMHPPPGTAVTPLNWKALAVGVVSEAIAVEAGTHVVAPLVIQDAATIQLVDKGERRECSCGYHADLDETPGEYEGEKYDAIQKNIRYNHVAIGPAGWGRAGPSVALRLDSGDAIQDETNEQERQAMKITIDGKEYEAGSPEAIAAEAALRAARDTAMGRADSLTSKVDSLTKELGEAKDPKALQARVKVRADLVMHARKAAGIKGVTFDEAAAEALTDTDFMSKIIQLLDPAFKPEGKSPDYIRGAFETTIMGLVGTKGAGTEGAPVDGTKPPAAPAPGAPPGSPPIPDSIFSVRDGGGAGRQDGTGGTFSAPTGSNVAHADASYQKMVQAGRDAWKIPAKA